MTEGYRMTKEIIFMVEDEPEGGYIAKTVSCHFGESGKPSVIRPRTVKEEVIPA